jgi:hypothetical protein
MKLLLASMLIAVLHGTCPAEINSTHLQLKDRKFIIAQSYCAMCAGARTTCVLKCNGAGACIQQCGDDFRSCQQQNCGRR